MTGQLSYKQSHSSVLVDKNLYLWGGFQDELPMVHDSEEKLPFRSQMNILNVPKMEWRVTESAGGVPPYGLMNYGCATVDNDIFVFGGRCAHSQSCTHNDLHAFNTVDRTWKSIPCSNSGMADQSGPMKKYSCGFIAMHRDSSGPAAAAAHNNYYLLALGGRGKPHNPLPDHSIYIPFEDEYYTNEVHVMDISNSLGDWCVPTIVGQRPPSIAWLTINLLPHNQMKCVLFGGYVVTEPAVGEWTNDLYIVTLSTAEGISLTFDKISRGNSLCQWPKCRDSHSSCMLTATTDADCSTNHLCIVGGAGAGRTIGDCWDFNFDTKSWNKIVLPESVCARESHSLVSYAISANTQWLIVVGGEVDFSQIQGNIVTMVAEIVYFASLSQWITKRVWNYKDGWTTTEQWLDLEKDFQLFFVNERKSTPNGSYNELLDKIPSLEDMLRLKTDDSSISLVLEDLPPIPSLEDLSPPFNSQEELSPAPISSPERKESKLEGQSGASSLSLISAESSWSEKSEERSLPKVCKIIKEVMDRNHASLSELFEDSLKEVSESMLSAGIISRIRIKEPSTDTIINSFNAGLNFKQSSVQEIENRCISFLNVLYDLGGPFSDAAQSIQTQIIETVSSNLKIRLTLTE